MSKSVYLAGGISGLSYDEAVGWRKYVRLNLHPDIEIRSPMRGKEYLENQESIAGEYNALMSTAPAFTTRDRYDVMNCDIVLMNFLNSKTLSGGSFIEIGMADILQKPLIMVCQKDNPNYHPMATRIAGWVLDDLDAAIEVCNRILILE